MLSLIAFNVYLGLTSHTASNLHSLAIYSTFALVFVVNLASQ